MVVPFPIIFLILSLLKSSVLNFSPLKYRVFSCCVLGLWVKSLFPMEILMLLKLIYIN